MTNRSSLSILLLLALLAWIGLVLFTRFVAPGPVLVNAIFVIILTLALTCTLTPVVYTIGQLLLAASPYHTTVPLALRQGALLAFVIVLNLILRALHSWNIFTALIILAAAIVIEILFLCFWRGNNATDAHYSPWRYWR